MSALLLACSLSTPSVAGQYRFNHAGTVDRVDRQSAEIVIDDMLYQIGQNVLLQDINNNIVSPDKLVANARVGLNLSQGNSPGGPGNTIYEIWILPDNFDLSTFNQDDD